MVSLIRIVKNFLPVKSCWIVIRRTFWIFSCHSTCRFVFQVTYETWQWKKLPVQYSFPADLSTVDVKQCWLTLRKRHTNLTVTFGIVLLWALLPKYCKLNKVFFSMHISFAKISLHLIATQQNFECNHLIPSLIFSYSNLHVSVLLNPLLPVSE